MTWQSQLNKSRLSTKRKGREKDWEYAKKNRGQKRDGEGFSKTLSPIKLRRKKILPKGQTVDREEYGEGNTFGKETVDCRGNEEIL